MKRTFFIMVLIGLLGPNASIAQDAAVAPRLLAAGYLLLKESNELSFIKTDLTDYQKKLSNLGELDNLKWCYITRLIENIALVEIICKYESIILGTSQYIEEDHKFEYFKAYENRLTDDTLKRLYSSYQNTGSSFPNLEDKEILHLTDKAKKEMYTAAMLIEEVIAILQSQSKASQ